MSLKITPEIRKAQKKLGRLQKKIPAELAKAINKTATRSRKSIVSQLSRVSGAKKKNIRRLLPIQRADGRNPKKLFALIKIRGKKLPMLALSSAAKAFGSGLQAKVAKKKIFIKRGFIARMPNGHRGIFNRAKGVQRLPITEEMIESNPEIYKAKGIQRIEEKRNERTLEKFFLKNLQDLAKKFNL